jgi:hypothetical protein
MPGRGGHDWWLSEISQRVTLWDISESELNTCSVYARVCAGAGLGVSSGKNEVYVGEEGGAVGQR